MTSKTNTRRYSAVKRNPVMNLLDELLNRLGEVYIKSLSARLFLGSFATTLVIVMFVGTFLVSYPSAVRQFMLYSTYFVKTRHQIQISQIHDMEVENRMRDSLLESFRQQRASENQVEVQPEIDPEFFEQSPQLQQGILPTN